MLFVVCSLLKASLLLVGRCSLVARGCLLLAICRLWLDVLTRVWCLLFVAYALLRAVCCFVVVVSSLLFGVWCVLIAALCLLFGACYVMIGCCDALCVSEVWKSLCVVCCSLFVFAV